MATCEVCNNDYDKTFRVELADGVHVFDCMECAIHVIAPACPTCGIKILGHGVDFAERTYCCSSCARSATSHPGEFLGLEEGGKRMQPPATHL